MLWRVLIIFAVIGAAYYTYRLYWLDNLNARFELTPTDVSVEALGGTYHDCTISLTGDFKIEALILRQGEPQLFYIQSFKQWNGARIESIRGLGREVEIQLHCKEGRTSGKLINQFAGTE